MQFSVRVRGALNQYVQHGVAFFDTGQFEVEPLKGDGQAAVVDSQDMQNGGLKVVDVHGVGHDVVAKVVGFAVDHARFDTTSSHER